MKKLFVLLLAFAVVGGAFAQVTTAIAASGNIKVLTKDATNDNVSVFAPKGNGYDTITFKGTDKDGKFGFSITDQNWLADGFNAIRDWNAWYKGQWTKTIVGKLRNSDFRATLPNGLYANYLYGFDRISGYGALIETTTLGALTAGVNLAISDTAAPVADMLKKTDIGVKYAMEGTGTAYVFANLDLVAESNIIGLGFNFTGVENLTAAAIYYGTFASSSTHAFALGADYSMDKLGVAVEFDGKYASAFDGEIAAQVSYGVTEKMTAYVGGMYDFGGDYDAFGEIEYDYGNNMGSDFTIGYDGDLYYTLKLTYSVSF